MHDGELGHCLVTRSDVAGSRAIPTVRHAMLFKPMLCCRVLVWLARNCPCSPGYEHPTSTAFFLGPATAGAAAAAIIFGSELDSRLGESRYAQSLRYKRNTVSDALSNAMHGTQRGRKNKSMHQKQHGTVQPVHASHMWSGVTPLAGVRLWGKCWEAKHAKPVKAPCRAGLPLSLLCRTRMDDYMDAKGERSTGKNPGCGRLAAWGAVCVPARVRLDAILCITAHGRR